MSTTGKQIGELFIKLGFKIDAAQLDALDKQLDVLMAKAKKIAGVFQQAGILSKGGGGRGNGGGASSQGTMARRSNVDPEQAAFDRKHIEIAKFDKQQKAKDAAEQKAKDKGVVKLQADNHVQMWQWQQAQNAKNPQANAHAQMWQWQQKQEAEKKTALTQQIHWLRRLTEVSSKIALGLGAFNATMLAAVELGRRAATGLNQFGLNTGLDPLTLQRFQAVGSKFNVQPGQMEGALTALAKFKRDAAWGQADMGAASFLGLDPLNMSPEQMMRALGGKNSRLRGMGAQDQVSFLGRIGLGEEMQALFRQTQDLGGELDKVDTSHLLDGEATKRIVDFSNAFGKLGFDVGVLGQKFTDFASRHLKGVVEWLDKLVLDGEDFFNWLNGDTTGAKTLRTVLYGIADALAAVATAFTLLATIGAVKTLVTIAQLLSAISGALGFGAVAGGIDLLATALAAIPPLLVAISGALAGYGLGKLLGLDKVGESFGGWLGELLYGKPGGSRKEDIANGSYHPPV